MRRWLLAALLALTAPISIAHAEEAESPAAADPDIQEAQKTLNSYLDLLVKKKWDLAKKMVHPKTLELIAGIKKRTGAEKHGMAPQYWAKDDFWLKEFKIESGTKQLLDTVQFQVKEINYRVQEKGVDEGEPAAFLLGKLKGKWVIVDKKANNTFNDKNIKVEFRGYFEDAAPKADPKAEPAPESTDAE